jgi:hypothetical protein
MMANKDLWHQLRSALPDIIPQRDKDLVRMLRAAHHIHRYSASDTKRGRPSRWKREDLLKVSARLTDISERETSSPISLASFVDHYLRLLDFPSDVVQALSAGDINLFEAEQLARLNAKRLGLTSAQARRKRTDLMNVHIQGRLSGARLRQRVNELLKSEITRETGVNAESREGLEDFDPYDPTHLFTMRLKDWGLLYVRYARKI